MQRSPGYSCNGLARAMAIPLVKGMVYHTSSYCSIRRLRVVKRKKEEVRNIGIMSVEREKNNKMPRKGDTERNKERKRKKTL